MLRKLALGEMHRIDPDSSAGRAILHMILRDLSPREQQVIDLFTPETPTWSSRQVADKLDLPINQASDLLRALWGYNLLDRSGTHAEYTYWRLDHAEAAG